MKATKTFMSLPISRNRAWRLSQKYQKIKHNQMKQNQLTQLQRSFWMLLLLCCGGYIGHSQVTYLSPFTGNQGGGTPLFAQCVPDGNSDMFLDWEVFVDAAQCGSGTTGGGQGSDCRVIVRGMQANADPNSIIASAPDCIIDGIYNGENGNNDRYFVNLNACMPQLGDGRYSVEIQCDCQGGDYNNYTGNATAATTWNYFPNNGDSPDAYYIGSCGAPDGFDQITEVSTNGPVFNGPSQLDYFTIGDADVYRTMVVINGLFMDMGKFTPGNPNLPASLHDIPLLYPNSGACLPLDQFPPVGYCPSDVLNLDGAETNISKVVDCNGNGVREGFGDEANVTGNRVFYSVFPTGSPSNAFCNINIPFTDNCPDGFYPGTGGNVFPTGGNCQNLGCVQDQRWQVFNAGINLLECGTPDACLGVAGPGQYTLQLYTETDIVDCGGVASTVREPATAGTYYTTSFVVFTEDQARANKCTPELAISCTAETACDADDGCITVTLTDASNAPYSITYSPDGGALVTVTGTLNGMSLEACDLAPGSYTDLVVTDTNGCTLYAASSGCDINAFQVN